MTLCVKFIQKIINILQIRINKNIVETCSGS